MAIYKFRAAAVDDEVVCSSGPASGSSGTRAQTFELIQLVAWDLLGCSMLLASGLDVGQSIIDPQTTCVTSEGGHDSKQRGGMCGGIFVQPLAARQALFLGDAY